MLKKRTLTINGRFLTQPVTGVQRVGIEFCLALDEMLADKEIENLEVKLVAPRNAALVTDPALRCIKLVRSGRLRGHLWEQLELPWIARKTELLSLGNTAPVFSLVGRPARTHVMIHDLSYRYFPHAYGKSFRLVYEGIIPLVLRRAATVFTVSRSEREAMLREYPNLSRPERIIPVQNGTDRLPDGTEPGRSDRGRKCLYVGSLTKRKNAAGLIQTAIALARDHDATVTFVGSTPANFEEVDLRIPADVTDKIMFLGQLNDDARLSREYSTAAVFLFPSFYEASPLPPIEAMAHGCPVVASEIPSLRERCGDAAVYCDPNDPASIVTAAATLLDSSEEWARMASRGVSVSAGYSWKKQARAIIEHVLG